MLELLFPFAVGYMIVGDLIALLLFIESFSCRFFKKRYRSYLQILHLAVYWPSYLMTPWPQPDREAHQ